MMGNSGHMVTYLGQMFHHGPSYMPGVGLPEMWLFFATDSMTLL